MDCVIESDVIKMKFEEEKKRKLEIIIYSSRLYRVLD